MSKENKKNNKKEKFCSICYLIGVIVLLIPAVVELVKLFIKYLYPMSITIGFGLCFLAVIVSLTIKENKKDEEEKQ